MLQISLGDFACFDKTFPESISGVCGRGKNYLTVPDMDAFCYIVPTHRQRPSNLPAPQIFEDVRKRDFLNLPCKWDGHSCCIGNTSILPVISEGESRPRLIGSEG
jgi:hypothetical protein